MRHRETKPRQGLTRAYTRVTPRFGRWALVVALVLAAAVLLPISASAYLSTGTTADRNWFWQNPLSQGNDLRSTSWISSSVGWSVGVTGTALKTTDGGTTWTALDPHTTSDLTGVSFVDANTGWMVGVSAIVKKTTDGGATWTNQTAPTVPAARNLRGVSFFNTNVGVAVGDLGTTTSTIVYTGDGGATWRSASTTCTVGLSGVEMVSATTGWAVGGGGAVLKTTDGGATWVVQPSQTAAGLSAISFAPGGTVGYYVGNAVLPNWTIYKTTNSGATWTAVSGLGVTGAINLTGVDCLDANNAVAVGTNGQVRHTTNGGTTWLNQSVNNVGANSLRAVKMVDANNIKTIGDIGMFFSTSNSGNFWSTPMVGSAATYQSTCFVDATHGWAVGNNGTVMRTIDGGLTWTTQQSGITVWRGVHFFNVNSGWIVGDGGAIQHTTDGGATWVAQTSNSTQQLNGVVFTTATNGVAVGAAGTVLRTTNSGSTWSVRTSGVTNSLNAVYFPPGVSTGFAVGDGGRVLKSTNTGRSWTSLTSNTTQNLQAVRGVSATAVWAAGNGGTMIKSTNGTSWTTLTTGAGTNPIRTVFFINTLTGWYASNYGIVMKTTDGGANWTQLNAGMPTSALDPPTGIYGSWFVDANNGFLVGDSGTIRRTTDGGATWTSQQYGTQNTLNTICFPNALNGWIGGTAGFMLHTTDGGTTWSVQKTGSNNAFNAMSMISTSTGFGVGDNGAIRRTTDGGQTWVGQNSGLGAVNLKAISTVNGTNVITAGQGSVKYTSNAGSTWTTATAAPDMPVTGLASVSTTEAFATATRIAGNNVIWHTMDGGSTWTTQTTPANANLWAITFVDATTGFACGDSGIILRTTDAGATWLRMTTPTTLPFQAIDFADALHGVAVGGGGVIARTSDGGTTWSLQSSGTTRSLTGIAHANSNVAFASGSLGTILRSANLAGPTTSMFLTPAAPDGTNGWYQTNPFVSLLSDRIGGSTYYSWTSVSGPFSFYTGSFLATQGVPTLFYYSIDASSNAEAVKSASFLIDFTDPTPATLPTVSAIATSTAQADWLDGTDSISGVDHYDVYLNGTYVLSTPDITTSTPLDGLNPLTPYALTVLTVDQAGNVSTTSTAANFTTADNTPLVTTGTPTPLTANGTNGWYITTPTVTLASTPATVPAWSFYRWDSAALATYTVPVAVPSGGTHTLGFWSADKAGMRDDEATKTLTLKLDSTSPTPPSTLSASGLTTSSLAVSWSGASDAQSGVDHYDLWVAGAKYGTYASTTATVTGLAVNTTSTVYVVAVNGAGLSAVSATVSGHTLANPAVSTSATKSPLSPDGANGWYISSPTVALASFPTTVPAWTYYAWDGSAAATYSGTPVSMPSDGTHSLAYRSADRQDVTNRDATQTLSMKRDTVAPSPPITVTPTSIDTTTILVAWTLGSDATSGLDHYILYLDGAQLRTVAGTSSVVTTLTPNTLHSFAVASVDAAGNTGSPTAPVWAATNSLPALITTLTASPAAPNGTNSWYTTTPTVSFSVTPTVPAYTFYRWDASALTTASGSVSPPSLGTHTLSFWSVDTGFQRAQEATKQVTYKLDTTSPSSPTANVTPASTTSLSVSWTTASDAESGIDHYGVYVDGSLYATYTASTLAASVTGRAVDTSYTVQVRAFDGAGLAANSATLATKTLSNLAVFTADSVSPGAPTGTNGWYTTTPTVTLTASPVSVLTAQAYFAWDGANVTTYTVPITPPSDGTHPLTFLTVDTAAPSNRETTRTLTLKVDRVAPSAPTSVSAVTASTTSIDVDWALGADATSGVDHYDLYLDSVLYGSFATTSTTVTGLAPNSLHSFAVLAVDGAGNSSGLSPSTTGIAAAAAPLVTSVSPPPGDADGAHGWFTTTPSIAFSVSPAVSAWTHYSWDGSAMATATGPVSPSDGTHTLSYWSVDQANQHAAEATQQATYKVDSSAPTAPSSVAASGDSTSSLAITWNASSDAQSGVDYYEVFVDGSSIGTTSATSKSATGLAVNHTYSVYVAATNLAGLTAASTTVSGTTLSNPAISTTRALSPAAADGDNGWYRTSPSITLATIPSGLTAETYYRFDSSASTTYTVPVFLPGDGTHTLQYHSVDQADLTNRDATSSATIKLDTVAPAPPTTMFAATLDTTSVAVWWTAGSDATSGLDHYLVYVDGAPWGGSVTSTGTTVDGLTPNALHTFWVESVDAAGNPSIASPSVTAATGSLTPLTTTAAVTPLTADGTNGWYVTTPTVDFTVLPTGPSYTYYSWDGSALSTVTGPVSVPSNGTHTLSYWSVDQGGLRAAEPTQTLTLKLDALPDVHSAATTTAASIVATKTATTYNSADLSWAVPSVSAPSGLDHYEIWDDYVGRTTLTTYTVTGLTPLTTYGYKVYGVSSAGTFFSQSDTVTVNTSASPLPAAPAIVLAKSPAEEYAYINWTSSTDTLGTVSYRLWRSLDGVTYSAIATTTGGLLDCTYIDRGLSSTTRYWYAVSTVDDRGESPLSAHDATTWPSNAPVSGPPARPQGLTQIGTDSTIFLQWQPSTDPTAVGYIVLRASKSLASSATTLTSVATSMTSLSTTGNAFFDFTAVNGEPYYYSVRTVDASGTIGRPSLEIEARAQRSFADDLEPHSVGNEGPQACICHAAHAAAGSEDSTRSALIRFKGATVDTVCDTCHPPANALGEFLDPLAVSRHAQGSSVTTETPFTCNTCHVPVRHSGEATANLLRVNGAWPCVEVTNTPPGNGFCYSCHGKGSTLPEGDLTGFEDSGHSNVNAPATGANVKCDACHESHSSRNEHLNRYSGYMMCMQCHTSSTSDPNEPDIWGKLQMNEDSNAKHPLLQQDQVNGARMTCQNCHNTHSVTKTFPLVDPHDPSPAGEWTTPRSDEKAFCFRCHDGNALPVSAETTPWADAVLASGAATTVVNIKDSYATNVHGFGQRSSSATTTAYLRPDMGYAYGTVLECRSCHDPHGTANNFALQQNVTSSSGNKTINGVVVSAVPGGGYDLRFFCNTCHLWDSSTHDSRAATSTVNFPMDCTSCHRHVRTDGTPSRNL